MYLFIYLFIYLRGEGREKERERNNVWLPLLSSPREPACNPGMCSDWELNQQLFGLQPGTQSTETHEPGLKIIFQLQLTDNIPFDSGVRCGEETFIYNS